MPGAAAALDLKCVEPSRYKNLLQVFDDDPAILSTYFQLDGTRAPDLNACRAMALTGTIRDGDAGRLIDAVIQNKGWLDVLYLAFDGVDLREEIRLAYVIRGFRLKTRVLEAWPLRYEPDFATSWAAPVEAANEAPITPSQRLSPISRGLEAFAKRGDLDLPISGASNMCLESCVGAWAAGVHRRLSPVPPIAVPGPAATPEIVTEWPRRALSIAVNGFKLPAPEDRTWKTPVFLGMGPVIPPDIERLVRAKCTDEIVAGEALEGRIGGSLESFARDDFSEVGSTPHPVLVDLDSLRMAGLRLQRCVARAFEHQRLASFDGLCNPSCDKPKLVATFDRMARDFADKQITLANILGAHPSGKLGREWREDEPGWVGIWLRRANGSGFDATWSSSGAQQASTAMDIGRVGNRVAAVRVQAEGRCLYQGTIAADEKTAQGTFTCYWAPGIRAWSATIAD
jgi:hypothetical protein